MSLNVAVIGCGAIAQLGSPFRAAVQVMEPPMMEQQMMEQQMMGATYD